MEKPAVQKPSRVTIREVAIDAGVSVAAVSKVLRDAYGVSESMRLKVRKSMAKLGYRPHTAARGMRGQTFTLGMILPDLRNPFFSDILAGVNSALERTQYQVLLGVSQSGTTFDDALVDSMIDRQMDGLILIGPTDQQQLLDIAKRKPLATIGNHAPGVSSYDTVNNDDYEGGTLAVRHLSSNGYRNIAMLSLITESTIITQRELGYRREMMEQELGSYINVVRARQTMREVQIAAKKLLEAPDRPEAIFCWTDFIALEVISVATEMGLSIPRDLAVVGYDNTMYCDFAQNSLTSVDQSGELLGLQSVRLLIERIKGRTESEHFVVTPRVVARNSSADRLG
ncbi:LacI family DNA-binding transcriptional regulator [Devosia psychrophila]|jgi:LacI family transcriptional regulator|uniref:Transcriptional regulator, LacI family n=1 Tax=Devosia psychrophila TaxID=728005 RepID=A0A0F5PXC1_9HYPH|nr:LacI family DNA-binding transcriptional regulator [Devosia psychrophila]KKC33317.1 transcriptional regulator, LacI family protein [Devosia psychrophila]SFC22494.1 transcriptional regulator, LacI family [Devosia psychrophila]